MRKLYCYVDESGQDTYGEIFLVSIVLVGKERDQLKEKLLEIEKKTGKKIYKWRKTKFETRNEYLDQVFSNKIFQDKLFYSKHLNTKSYVDLTIMSSAKAILLKEKKDYKVTVFVDGLNKKEVRLFAKGLR